MTSNPVTVNKNVTLSEVEIIFEEHDFNGVPVVDERKKLIGMMTKLDLLKAFSFTVKSKIPLYDDIMDQKISSAMTNEPDVVYPETPLTRVLQNMTETGQKSLIVVEDDRVVGIVSREDIIRALRKASLGLRPQRDG